MKLNKAQVQLAIAQLQGEGKPITVHGIKAITGGSFYRVRDLLADLDSRVEPVVESGVQSRSGSRVEPGSDPSIHAKLDEILAMVRGDVVAGEADPVAPVDPVRFIEETKIAGIPKALALWERVITYPDDAIKGPKQTLLGAWEGTVTNLESQLHTAKALRGRDPVRIKELEAENEALTAEVESLRKEMNTLRSAHDCGDVLAATFLKEAFEDLHIPFTEEARSIDLAYMLVDEVQALRAK